MYSTSRLLGLVLVNVMVLDTTAVTVTASVAVPAVRLGGREGKRLHADQCGQVYVVLVHVAH